MLTGGTGFVGANLVRRLLAAGHSVGLLVRPNSNFSRIKEVQDHCELFYVNLCDRSEIKQALSEFRPDWIFHLAAFGNYSWQKEVEEIVQTNFLSTVRLLEAAREVGFEAFVNTGSSAEYGFKNHAPKETDLVEPNSYYAVTKVACTHFCQFTARNFGLRIPTLRMYSAFGAWEDPRRFLPTLIRHGLNGTLPPLVDPRIARDFIDVDDVVDAYLLLAQHPAVDNDGVFNIGTGVQTTIAEAVDLARSVFDIAEEPAWGTMENRSWDSGTWYSDPSLAKQSLGFSPKYDFERGFRRMVDWAREHQDFLITGS